MQQPVSQTKIHDVDELKQRLIDVCHSFELEQSVINDAVDRWPKRLRTSTHVKGGH